MYLAATLRDQCIPTEEKCRTALPLFKQRTPLNERRGFKSRVQYPFLFCTQRYLEYLFNSAAIARSVWETDSSLVAKNCHFARNCLSLHNQTFLGCSVILATSSVFARPWMPTGKHRLNLSVALLESALITHRFLCAVSNRFLWPGTGPRLGEL